MSRKKTISTHFQWIKKNKKRYLNIPVAFDVETYSFIDANGEKRASMYIWTARVDKELRYGRTWEEFLFFLKTLKMRFGCDENSLIIIYVHNLSYEFQFMRKWFEWEKVFAIDSRKPVYARTKDGIEFRCSYILSGRSLAQVGDILKAPLKKLVGDLDYAVPRNRLTKLTFAEYSYCFRDVEIVGEYIREQIEYNGDITKIPLTKTGYVRRTFRNFCVGSKNPKMYGASAYRRLVSSLTLNTTEYIQLKRAFQGGFTHANAFYSDMVIDDVSSYDFTSSYPAVMVAEKFPMSKSEEVVITSENDFRMNLAKFCCLFDVEFTEIYTTFLNEHYLSESKCYRLENANVDNGRIVSASTLTTTITEQDFYIIERFYTWKTMRISNFRRYYKSYLPTEFISVLLDLYAKKTTLKGVVGSESEYMRSKENANASFGMCVTDISRNEYTYVDEWETVGKNIDSDIETYNKSKGRFLFYPWGVWIAAYARANLFTAIYECNNDYIYSDTDSVKIKNADLHTAYFEKYNRYIIKKLENALEYHKLPLDLIRPKTIKGAEKTLGVWDYEGKYVQFKTLGAKRYLTEDETGYRLTVAGLGKKDGISYLESKYGSKIFDAFSDNLYIPKGKTGKLCLTYIDDEKTGAITDLNGVTCEYDELSSVHAEPADYSLKLSSKYIDFIKGVQNA